MYGKNFADDRGNVTSTPNMRTRTASSRSDVPWLRSSRRPRRRRRRCRRRAANGSDGIPDRIFFRDIRSATINRFGLIPITQRERPPTAGLCGRGISATMAPNSAGLPYNCTYIFDARRPSVPADRHPLRHRHHRRHHRRQRPDRARRQAALGPAAWSATTSTCSRTSQFSDAVRAVRRGQVEPGRHAGQQRRPVVHPGHRSSFDFRERVRLDNPFLTPGAADDDRQCDPRIGLPSSLTAACNVDTGTGVAANS